MKTPLRLALLIAISALFGIKLYAQVPPTPSSFEVFAEFITPLQLDSTQLNNITTGAFADTIRSADNNLTYVITLPDSSGIDSLIITCGTNTAGDNVFRKAYSINSPAILPDNTTFTRDGLTFYIGVGAFYSMPAFNARAQVRSTNGNLSAQLSYTQ